MSITAAQMRRIEQDAIQSGRATGMELMERAGLGVVEAIFEEWPEFAKGAHHAVVLCGPGNNGGDGFVVARLLSARDWAVDVYLYGDAHKLPPDARTNYETWTAIGPVHPYHDEGAHAFRLEPKIRTSGTITIDALFGTGLTRPLRGLDAFAREARVLVGPRDSQGDTPGPRVVAVDIPSGLHADTGAYLRPSDPEERRRHQDVQAHLTVTFHSAKHGHLRGHGPQACGKLVVKDIGL